MYKSFVIALVLIASAVSPAHSAALGCVVLLNLAIPADVFVAFAVASQTTLLLMMPPQTNAPFVAFYNFYQERHLSSCMSRARCVSNGLKYSKKCTEDTVLDLFCAVQVVTVIISN